MTTISAKSVLASRHSLDPKVRIDTLLLRYPRCIHAEFMTHRVFSRNAASSRAIPVSKLIEDVITDPFMPLFWGSNQKGMQAGEETNTQLWIRHNSLTREEAWAQLMWQAIDMADAYLVAGYHKQIVNRLLEPFAHITVVVTGTQWSNFLALRDHSDAEPHIQILAQRVREALDSAEIHTLEPGMWHLPFVSTEEWIKWFHKGEELKKLSVARCASTSFKTVEGFDMTFEQATRIYEKLLGQPMHASPFEHQAQADSQYHGHRENKWQRPKLGGNLGLGWIQLRKTIPGECI